MLVNDPIQGILFDANEHVVFAQNRSLTQKVIDPMMRMKLAIRLALQKRKDRHYRFSSPYTIDDSADFSMTELLERMNHGKRDQ